MVQLQPSDTEEEEVQSRLAIFEEIFKEYGALEAELERNQRI